MFSTNYNIANKSIQIILAPTAPHKNKNKNRNTKTTTNHFIPSGCTFKDKTKYSVYSISEETREISPAMNTLSILSPQHPSTLSILTSSIYKTSIFSQTLAISQTLGFCSPRSFRTPASQHSPQFRASFKSPSSLYPVEPQLSDADDDDDDDDDVAADEYDDISGDASEGVDQSDDETEISIAAAEVAPIRQEEFKWQRAERLCNEVREFGEDIIDADELASIYDFRIDKFQVYFYANSQITIFFVFSLFCIKFQ